MTAEGIGSRQVAHAVGVGGGQLQEGGGQISHRDGAADVVREEHSVSPSRDQVVYRLHMFGTLIADDQRSASDDGARVHEADAGLGRRLCRAVGG